MKPSAKQILGGAALAYALCLSVAFLFAGSFPGCSPAYLTRAMSDSQTLQDDSLTDMQVSFLRELGVVTEDEEVLWLVSLFWPNIERSADLVITSRRVAGYWLTNERLIERSSTPDEQIIRHKGLLYRVTSHPLETILSVETRPRAGPSGNFMILSLADGSESRFCALGTNPGVVTRMRADILERAEALRDR